MRFKVANYSRLEIRLDTLHIYNDMIWNMILHNFISPYTMVARITILNK